MTTIESLTQEQWDDLFHNFESLRESNNIAWSDIKRALEIVGVSVAGHEIRDLVGQPRNWLNLAEFNDLYMRAKDMKDTTKAIRKALLLKHSEDVKSFTVGKNDTDTRHSVSKAEERGFTLWINKRLGHDTELQNEILPIDPSIDGQLYQRCKNGILLCKLVNVASPDTIDERSINRGAALKNVFNVHENLTLAVNSAASIGCCVVNTGPEDIMQGKRHIVLGLIWQLIRRGLVDTITLNKHGELLALLHDGENAEDLAAMKPEELLMRWVNYHLHRAGCDRRITNFNSDLADSVVYAHLMEQIVPLDKRYNLMSADEILSSTSRQERAINVLNNAETLNTPFLLAPEDIYLAGDKDKENRDRLNLAFLATLFNMYPGLDTTRGDLLIEGETLEERTYRNWMNSLGVKPYVTFLYTDLSNGLVLLQLVDKIKSGTVDWSLVVQNFDPKRRLFQEIGNCNLVVDSAKSINIRLVNVSGEDIQNRDRKLILGVCFTLMHAYTFKLLYEVTQGGRDLPSDDKDILAWVNEQLTEAKARPINSFRDPAISTGIPILQLLEHIKPNSTNKSIWLEGDSDDFSLCQYAISCCRKAGARVFTLPEHLKDINGKMILTLFACLQVLYFSLKQKAENKQNRIKTNELKWLKLTDDNKTNGIE
uniref:Lymphocyte cytosolic protein 1 n=1 Tax=Schistosoma japonicum TaxID=6182 RepID=C7TXR1_SCHJA|nr:Lymphocyte cytosolic protein 1 [Schistosoma japonicum]